MSRHLPPSLIAKAILFGLASLIDITLKTAQEQFRVYYKIDPEHAYWRSEAYENFNVNSYMRLINQVSHPDIYIIELIERGSEDDVSPTAPGYMLACLSDTEYDGSPYEIPEDDSGPGPARAFSGYVFGTGTYDVVGGSNPGPSEETTRKKCRSSRGATSRSTENVARGIRSRIIRHGGSDSSTDSEGSLGASSASTDPADEPASPNISAADWSTASTALAADDSTSSSVPVGKRRRFLIDPAGEPSSSAASEGNESTSSMGSETGGSTSSISSEAGRSTSSTAAAVDESFSTAAVDKSTASTAPETGGSTRFTTPVVSEATSSNALAVSESTSSTAFTVRPSISLAAYEAGPSTSSAAYEASPSTSSAGYEAGPSTSSAAYEAGPSTSSAAYEAGPSTSSAAYEAGPSTSSEAYKVDPSTSSAAFKAGRSTSAVNRPYKGKKTPNLPIKNRRPPPPPPTPLPPEPAIPRVSPHWSGPSRHRMVRFRPFPSGRNGIRRDLMACLDLMPVFSPINLSPERPPSQGSTDLETEHVELSPADSSDAFIVFQDDAWPSTADDYSNEVSTTQPELGPQDLEEAPGSPLAARLRPYDPEIQGFRRHRAPSPRPYPSPPDVSWERLRGVFRRDRLQGPTIYDQGQCPSYTPSDDLNLFGRERPNIEHILPHRPMEEAGPGGVCIPPPEYTVEEPTDPDQPTLEVQPHYFPDSDDSA